jgi:hypothetical protein
MLLQLLGVQADPSLDIAVTILAVFVVGVAVARLARELFRIVTNDKRVPEAIREIVRVAAESTLAAIRDKLQDLDPEAQEAEVRATADKVYEKLPATIPVPIGSRVYPIPLKMIVSKSLFESLVVLLYNEVDEIHENMLDAIIAEYEYWKLMGRPAPA